MSLRPVKRGVNRFECGSSFWDWLLFDLHLGLFLGVCRGSRPFSIWQLGAELNPTANDGRKVPARLAVQMGDAAELLASRERNARETRGAEWLTGQEAMVWRFASFARESGGFTIE